MTNEFHILNGDNLAVELKSTKFDQNHIVCREALIDGPVNAITINELLNKRARYLSETFHVSGQEYFLNVVSEFERINSIPPDSEVNLWFENDLFCQANMWFVLYLLANINDIKVYRIFPVISNPSDEWKGFGISNSKLLEQAYESRVLFQEKDLKLAADLWKAYSENKLDKLMDLSNTSSNCFRHLNEVCRAHADRFPTDHPYGRPEKVISELIQKSPNDFQHVFAQFSSREGVYGFGDSQFRIMYEKQLAEGQN